MSKSEKKRRPLPGLRLRIVLHFILITLASLVLVSLVSVRLNRKMLQNRERQIVSVAARAAHFAVKDGVVQASNPFSRTLLPTLKNIGLIAHYGIYCAQSAGQWQLSSGEGSPPDGFLARTVFASEKVAWRENVREIKLLRLIPRPVGVDYIGELKNGCYLALYQDFSRAEHGIKLVKNWLAGYVLSFALIMAGLGYLLISRVVSPLEEVAQVAGRIAEGEHDLRLAVQSTDELNELAQAFNVMTARLLEQQSDLQKRNDALAKLNEELRHAQHDIVQQEKLASIGRLAAGLAHEIGNPLAAVIGYLEIVKRAAKDKGEISEYAAKIDHELVRIEKLMRQLLDYSRPGTGHSMNADLQTVLRDSLKHIEARGLLQGIEVQQKGELSIPVAVDSEQLRQVLINVLQNAAQSMTGEGVIEIGQVIGTEPTAGRDWHLPPAVPLAQCVLLRIKDSGSGIAEGDLGQIFDPFFTTKDPGFGTGLGLYLAVNVIKAISGGIRVESKTGDGSLFEVALPIASNGMS